LNTKTVKASDFDKDGDLDVFVGGHIQPNRFPVAEKSAILWNDGKGHFTKQELDAFGLVTDAAIDDFDQNGSSDIFIVGEWMSPMILKNKGNKKFETQQQIFLQVGTQALLKLIWTEIKTLILYWGIWV
jgi:hypothetical protein